MTKRGQITIFIILGLFLTLVFGMLYGLSNIERERFVDQLYEDQTIITSSASFRSYLDDCVRSKTESVVDKVFKQGGKSHASTSDYEYSGSFVSMGISNNISAPFRVAKDFNSSGTLFSKNLPLGLFVKNQLNPYFGKNTLPKLCDKYGSNSIVGSDENNPFSCQPSLYGQDGETTVQSVIEDELSLDVASCFSNVLLDRQFTYDSKGSGTASVAFSDDAVIVTLDLDITFGDSQNTISKPTFTVPLRAKKLYTAAHFLIEEDIRNIFFDKANNYTDLCGPCFQGIQVFVVDDFNGTDSDLVLLFDSGSKLTAPVPNSMLDPEYPFNNSLLTLAFFVENRRPYFEKISDIVVPGDNVSALPVSESRRTFYIPTIAIDPDDDNITSLTFVVESVTSVPTMTSPPFVPPLYLPLNTNIVAGCSDHCHYTGGSSDNPNNYAETVYSLNVSVTDQGGKSDYQTFTITVDPLRS